MQSTLPKRTTRARPSRINVPRQEQHGAQALGARLPHSVNTPVSASFKSPTRASPQKSPRLHKTSAGSSPGTPIRAPTSSGRKKVPKQGMRNVMSPSQHSAMDTDNSIISHGQDEHEYGKDDADDDNKSWLEILPMPDPTPAELAAERRRLTAIYDPRNPPPDDPVTAEGTALGILPAFQERKWIEKVLRLGRWATSGHVSYVSGQYGPPEPCTIDQLRPEERLLLDIDFMRSPIVSRRPVKGGKGRKDTRDYWAKRGKILAAEILKRRGASTVRSLRTGAFTSGPTIRGEAAAARTPVSASTPTAQIFGEWASTGSYQGSVSDSRSAGPTQSAGGAATSKARQAPPATVARSRRKPDESVGPAPDGTWDAPEYILPVGRPVQQPTMKGRSKTAASTVIGDAPRDARVARVSMASGVGRGGSLRGSGRAQSSSEGGKVVSWAPLPSDGPM